MHIFFGDGYLGNQLFQYAFIKYKLKPRFLITTNFFPLLNLISIDKNVNILNIKNKYLVFFLRKFFIYFLILSSYLRMINFVCLRTERYKGTVIEKKTLIKKRGLLPITFIFPHFFQNSFFFPELLKNKIRFKKKHVILSDKFFSKIPLRFNKVFVHVRLGQIKKETYHVANELNDVKNFTIFNKRGVNLPLKYYHNQIKWFQLNIKNPYFIIISDNINLAKKKFSYIKNISFSEMNVYSDFVLMTKCEYAILSNSSLSWWGSFLMLSKKIIIAPKFWLGWKSKRTFPEGIIPSYARVVEF
jgi:hypothetical protein